MTSDSWSILELAIEDLGMGRAVIVSRVFRQLAHP
jgi:hypothetical protein